MLEIYGLSLPQPYVRGQAYKTLSRRGPVAANVMWTCTDTGGTVTDNGDCLSVEIMLT